MANPNSPTNGAGAAMDFLVNAAGTSFYKLGVGSVTVAAASSAAASAAVATHADTGSAGATDGVVVVAGENGTTVKHIVVDPNGVLWSNAPQPVLLLTSSARTVDTSSADQTTPGAYRGLRVYVNVTVAGTGDIILHVEGKDQLGGAYYPILDGTDVTTNGLNVYTVYPTITAVSNVIAQDVVPLVWRIRMEAAVANSITYSVSGVYLV